MSEALFLRLLTCEDKPGELIDVISEIREGQTLKSVVYVVNPLSFAQMPGSTFAYWASQQIKGTFGRLPAFEGEGRTAKKGITSSDDFRFVRLWWEIRSDMTVTGTSETTPEEYQNQTFKGKRWIPFAKGGSYSPYYADIHLVVNWERDAEEMKNFKDLQTGKAFSYLRNIDFQFRPGLTWPIKNRFTFKPRPLNAGCIFAHVGATAFVANENDLLSYLALLSSSIFTILLRLISGWNFEVGAVQHTPIPKLSDVDKANLRHLALACLDRKRYLDKANETSHIFLLPELLLDSHKTLSEGITLWERRLFFAEQQLNEYQREIDEIAFRLYGIDDQDRRALEDTLDDRGQEIEDTIEEVDNEEGSKVIDVVSADAHSLVANLLSYALGCAYGCWDIRFATAERSAPELPDPFAPLPVCSHGMLTDNDGLPATKDHIVGEEWLRMRPNADVTTLPPVGIVQQSEIQFTQYPITVAWNGILVDDIDHLADIVRRVRDVLAVLWPSEDGAMSEAIEREASAILGVRDLREYFRWQAGFFAHHLKRYSKSRRQAPIYWPLSTASGSYTLWIYYHRLTSDTLFTAVNRYVEPKITEIQRKIGELERRLTGVTGREATRLREEVEYVRTFLAELQDFRAELLRVAALPYRPDLNDGVIINAAPLHRLFRLPKWAKDTKACWEKLQRGEYDWAHLAYTIWPDRVREKCRADRSIAIAHDLEHLYLEQPTMAQRKRSRKAVPDKEDEE